MHGVPPQPVELLDQHPHPVHRAPVVLAADEGRAEARTNMSAEPPTRSKRVDRIGRVWLNTGVGWYDGELPVKAFAEWDWLETTWGPMSEWVPPPPSPAAEWVSPATYALAILAGRPDGDIYHEQLRIIAEYIADLEYRLDGYY